MSSDRPRVPPRPGSPAARRAAQAAAAERRRTRTRIITSIAVAVAVVAVGIVLIVRNSGNDKAAAPEQTVVETTVARTLPPGAVTTTIPPKPKVNLPKQLPTELTVTDLRVGEGPAAKAGDTVVLYYLGVLSKDGTEFDSTFDKGAPINVVLGAGQVIEGWDRGLIGVHQGGERQLDIPAALAYGDHGSGEIIKPGDALTFVIDVVAVVPSVNPADEPAITEKPAKNVESLTKKDLVVGTGVVPKVGQTAAIQILAFRADTGQKIESTWANGQPFVFTFGIGEAILGFDLVVKGMHVGGRREATIPFTLAFGAAGNQSLGLPPNTDLVVVIDLVAVY